MHTAERFQSPTTTLSVILVTLTDTLHETVHTASQMLLLLRRTQCCWGGEEQCVQASELQEIKKLIKEAERLRAMADTASIAVSDAEDWGSEDDDAKGAAVNRNRSPLSSQSRVILAPSISKSQTSPSKSYLLAATVPHSCVPQTHARIVTHKKVHFPLVLSSAPRLEPQTDCSFLSCSYSKCDSFKNSKGLWLVYSQTTASCQQRAGCKCDQCRKFYTSPGDEWNEVSACHSFSRVHLTEHISA